MRSWIQNRSLLFSCLGSKKDTNAVFAVSSQVDYTIDGSWYLNGSVLYNSGGQSDAVGISQLMAFRLSPKNLMPGRFTLSLQAQKTITPILTAGASVVYSPEINLLLLLPSLSYSVSENWSIDLIGQVFFAEDAVGEFSNLGNLGYLRVKWSY